MEEVILYILKKYGLLLSESEVKDLLKWFEQNRDTLFSEDDIDLEVKKYLYNKYKGRPLHFYDEDLSNMKYLLSLLKKQTEKKNK